VLASERALGVPPLLVGGAGGTPTGPPIVNARSKEIVLMVSEDFHTCKHMFGVVESIGVLFHLQGGLAAGSNKPGVFLFQSRPMGHSQNIRSQHNGQILHVHFCLFTPSCHLSKKGTNEFETLSMHGRQRSD
jgi:hypothetical protein